MKKYVLFLILSAWSYSLHAQAFWQKVDLKTSIVYNFFMDDQDRLYIKSRSGYWRSSDQGKTWSDVSQYQKCEYRTPFFVQGRVFCGGYDDRNYTLVSENDGQTWQRISLPTESIAEKHSYSMSVSNRNTALVTAQTYDTSLNRTITEALEFDFTSKSWRVLNKKEQVERSSFDGYVYRLGTDSKTFERSADSITWEKVYYYESNFSDSKGNPDTITSWGQVGRILLLSTNLFIFRSVDGGQTWSKTTSPESLDYPYFFPSSLESPYFILSGMNKEGVYRKYYSKDGITWQVMNATQSTVLFSKDQNVYWIDDIDTLHRQSISNPTQETTVTIPNFDFVQLNQVIQVSRDESFAVGDCQVFKGIQGNFERLVLPRTSTNAQQNPCITKLFVTNNGFIYALRLDYGIDSVVDSAIYESRDGGKTWKWLSYPSSEFAIDVKQALFEQWIPVSITKEGDFYFESRTNDQTTRKSKTEIAHTRLDPYGIFYPLKDRFSSGEGSTLPIYKVIQLPTKLYARSLSRLYKQSNGSWEVIYTNSYYNYTDGFLPYKGNLLIFETSYYGTKTGRVSVDEGKTWQAINGDFSPFSVTADAEGNLWALLLDATTNTKTLGTSNDLGQTWRFVDGSLPQINRIFFDASGYLYTSSVEGTFKSAKPQSTSEFQPISLPSTFSTSVAYPNPFSQSTTFGVSLPKASRVNIGIYNMLGQRIHTLSDVDLPAGTYSFDWQANDVPSGVYFARITADGKVQSQKLTVVH
jgi:photosystem II stability/assembly factor-like uncharacterized protein